MHSSSRPVPEVRPDREHVVTISRSDVAKLRKWLEFPNGASPIMGTRHQSVHFEAVEGGAVMVRTQPFRYNPPQGV